MPERNPSGSTYGIALIGAGWIAESVHIPNLRASSRCHLCAVVDRSTERRRDLERKHPDIPVVEHADAVFADAAVDAVVLCCPPNANAQLAATALRAGKHVFVEKPGAGSPEDLGAIIAAHTGSGRVVHVGYNFRFARQVLEARSAIAERSLGSILSVQGVFRHGALGNARTTWRQDLVQGGGALTDLAVHHIDLVRFMLGEPVRAVSAFVDRTGSAEQIYHLALQMPSGAVVQIAGADCAGSHGNRFEITGSDGSLVVDLLAARPAAIDRLPGRLARVRRAVRRLATVHPKELWRDPAEEPTFAAALANFLGALDGRDSEAATLEDALAVLDVVAAARASVAHDGAARDIRAKEPRGIAR